MQTNQPKVSVAVRAYNQAKEIVQTLKSITTQKVSWPIEIVIGIDPSTDNTADIVRLFCETLPPHYSAIIIQNENKLGSTGNLISVFQHCNGEYIAWLDGDDYWIDPYKTQKEVEILDKQQEYGVVYTDHYIASNQHEGLKEIRRIDTDYNSPFDTLIKGNPITSDTVLFRRKLLQHIDWHELGKVKADDYFIWLEFSMHTKFYHLKEFTSVATVFNRVIGKEIVLPVLKYGKELLTFQKIFIDKYNASHETPANVTKDDLDYDFQKTTWKASLLLGDAKMGTKVARYLSKHSTGKEKYYYFFNSLYITFKLYYLYRRLTGKRPKDAYDYYFF